MDLAWFSPDCTHHSKARGGKPKDKKIRGLAWVTVKWAQQVRPKVIILENVEEFKDWGPLNEENQPIKAHQGMIFDIFLDALRELGYTVDHRELRACDYGAPTIRKRFFLVARCDGEPIRWPKKTHGPGKLPYRTAAECIDWTIPCHSIFDRERPLAEATLRRIAKGVVKFVLQNPRPFLIQYHGETSANQVRGQETSAPLMVVDSSPRYALIDPLLVKNNFGHTPFQGIDVPLHTITTQGNRFALVAAFLAKHYGGVTGSPLFPPLGTVTAKDHHALVACHVLRQFGESTGSAADSPIGTIVAGGGGKTHLVASFLSKYYGQGIGEELNGPMGTVTSKDRFGLVTVTVEGEEYIISDVGMRMLQPRELYRAQGFPDDYIIDPVVDGKRLTKTAQVRMVGNSVCPPVAEALVRANFPEARVEEKTA